MKQHTVFSSVGAEDLLGALRLVVNTTAGAANETKGRQDLLAGLAQLVGADVWVWTLQRLDTARLGPVFYLLTDGGWTSEEQRLAWLESCASPEIGPLLFALAPQVHRHVTLCRSDLMTGAEWYASPFYLKHREPVGLDDLRGRLAASDRATGVDCLTRRSALSSRARGAHAARQWL